MPAEIWPGSHPSQLAGIGQSELQSPAPNRLVGDIDAALGEQVFDVAIAERKPEIQPNSALDDLRWKSMVAVGNFCISGRYRASYIVVTQFM